MNELLLSCSPLSRYAMVTSTRAFAYCHQPVHLHIAINPCICIVVSRCHNSRLLKGPIITQNTNQGDFSDTCAQKRMLLENLNEGYPIQCLTSTSHLLLVMQHVQNRFLPEKFLVGHVFNKRTFYVGKVYCYNSIESLRNTGQTQVCFLSLHIH